MIKILVLGSFQSSLDNSEINDAALLKVADILDKNGPFNALICMGSYLDDEWIALQAFKDAKKVGQIFSLHHSFPEQKGGNEISLQKLTEDLPGSYYDILLCKFAPAGMSTFSTKATFSAQQSDHLARKLTDIKCRYLFIENSSELFYEREPFETIVDGKQIYTRVLGIPKFSKNSRWFYAFQMDPNIIIAPKSFTADPFEAHVLAERKRKLEEAVDDLARHKHIPSIEDSPPDGYICRICQTPGHFIKNCPNKKVYVCKICNESGHNIRDCPQRSSKRSKFDPSNCWFCLSNKNAETHLVISVGEQIYVALSKGGCVRYHCLIIPITHVPQSDEIPDDVKNEISNCKTVFRTALEGIGKGFLTFSIKLPISHHSNIPIIPFDIEDIDAVLQHILSYGMQQGIIFENFSAEKSKMNYATIEASNGKKLVHYFDTHFDLLFFRGAIANYFGNEKLKDWRNSVKSMEEEIMEVNELRGLLK